MPRKSRSIALAVSLVAAAAGCGSDDVPRLTIRHLGDASVFAHCAAEFKGETRPATPCIRPIVVARAKDVPVPADGTLTVPLDTREVPAGPLQLSVEAYTYGDLDADPIARNSVNALDSVIASRQSDRLLGDTLGSLAALQPVARQHVHLPSAPPTYALPIPRERAGRRVVYVIWAWPVAPDGRRRVALERVIAPPDAGLSVGFAVAEPGWAPGSAPVLFTVSTPAPGGETVLWNRQLDPATRPEDRGWQTAEVDLGSLAGRSVTLYLTARIEQLAAAGSFPLWTQPVLLAPATDGGAEPPSILLVSFDTVRADHLSAYGYERPTSPALERLAAEGVLFEQAMAHFPSTTGSHMSLLTSQLPCAHRVTLPTLRLPAAVTTLAEVLSAAGYATGAVTEDALIKGDSGFDRGFDTYRDLLWAEHEPAAFQRQPQRVTGLFGQGLSLATAWIEEHADRPFFFFLHTYQPHVPFKVPAHLATLFPIEEGAPDMRRQTADYDAGLRNTDDLFANFLAALNRRGILDRVILVVTSDHGIELGDHGGFGHARGVLDEQVHVPLLFRHPTLASGGRRVRDVVPLLDVAPTLVELAGAAAPASFRGRSLAGALRGESRPASDRRVFAEQLWGPRQTLLRDDRWAWIANADGVLLYDMEADPQQRRNLAASEPRHAADGAARIDAFRQACKVEARALRAGESAAPLDPARQRALRLLGYAE